MSKRKIFQTDTSFQRKVKKAKEKSQEDYMKEYNLEYGKNFFVCPGYETIPHYPLAIKEGPGAYDVARRVVSYLNVNHKDLASSKPPIMYIFKILEEDPRFFTAVKCTKKELDAQRINLNFLYGFKCCCGLDFCGCGSGGGGIHQHIGLIIDNFRNYSNGFGIGCGSTFGHCFCGGHHFVRYSGRIHAYCQKGLEDSMKSWTRLEYADYLTTVCGERPAHFPDAKAEKALHDYFETELHYTPERRDESHAIRMKSLRPKPFRTAESKGFNWELYLESYQNAVGKKVQSHVNNFTSGARERVKESNRQAYASIMELANNATDYPIHDYEVIKTELLRVDRGMHANDPVVDRTECQQVTYSPVLQALEDLLEEENKPLKFSEIKELFFNKYPVREKEQCATLIMCHIRYNLKQGNFKSTAKNPNIRSKFVMISRREVQQNLPPCSSWIQ